jgi:hypothetical protein
MNASKADNVGGRMGEFSLPYLLCMLRFPVPLHSLLVLLQYHWYKARLALQRSQGLPATAAQAQP